MLKILYFSTPAREVLVDITSEVEKVVTASGIENGLCSVYVQGATAGIMIQENWDNSVQDFIEAVAMEVILH